MPKPLPIVRLTLEAIVGGGQALGTLENGQKCFVWGGLPGEEVEVQLTKRKRTYAEGVVDAVTRPSPERIAPLDSDSYLSTSPWQIMNFAAEQRYKIKLIEEAFALHHITLPRPTTMYSDEQTTHYRNKVEFSWYGNSKKEGETASETLDLAFFRRGSKGKIPIETCSLLPDTMLQLAQHIRDILHSKGIYARSLKTLLIRCDQTGQCVWQLYVKDEAEYITAQEAEALPALGGEVIYSDPRSPASRITKRLAQFGTIVLTDTILDTPFRYATEGFFQVNLPVYEQALRDMAQWIPTGAAVVDIYSGVGSIGLTIGGERCTLIEVDEHAVREMKRNIIQRRSNAAAILASSETTLHFITSSNLIIVDPPRAGLHPKVVARLLEAKPQRILYLSCNPATQARDISVLMPTYKMTHHQGYNFFPRTPHIEHLAVLDV